MAGTSRYGDLKIKSQLARGKYPEAQDLARGGPDAISREHFLASAGPRRLSPERQRPATPRAELLTIDRLIQNGARRYATAEGVRHDRADSSCCVAPMRVRCWISFTTSSPSNSPISWMPITPRPSSPWKKRTTRWRPKRSARRPRPPAEDPRFHYLLARASRRRGSCRVRQGAGRSPQDQPTPCATACCSRPTN